MPPRGVYFQFGTFEASSAPPLHPLNPSNPQSNLMEFKRSSRPLPYQKAALTNNFDNDSNRSVRIVKYGCLGERKQRVII